MSRIEIDFAPRGLRRSLHQLPPALLAAGVIGLALCVGAALAGYRTLDQQHQREAHLRHLQQRQAALAQASAARPRAAASVIAPDQAAAVNAAVLQLNLPWRELTDAVAAATPPTVALLTLEPDARKQVLRVSAETKTSDDMIAYLEQIKQQAFFSSVLLTRHEVMELDPNKPIRFQFEAVWSRP